MGLLGGLRGCIKLLVDTFGRLWEAAGLCSCVLLTNWLIPVTFSQLLISAEDMSGPPWGSQEIYKILSRHLCKALGSWWAVLLNVIYQLTNSVDFHTEYDLLNKFLAVRKHLQTLLKVYCGLWGCSFYFWRGFISWTLAPPTDQLTTDQLTATDEKVSNWQLTNWRTNAPLL